MAISKAPMTRAMGTRVKQAQPAAPSGTGVARARQARPTGGPGTGAPSVKKTAAGAAAGALGGALGGIRGMKKGGVVKKK
jgi:hypothetical protein